MPKKLIIVISLIVILFGLTGCSTNYMSLNDMAIVSSIIIDKKDDKYITHIEIYKEEKSENKSKKESFIVKAEGKHIKDAIDNASLLVGKTLYMVHINAIAVSRDAIDNNTEIIFNYLSRRIQLNSNYYILVTDDVEKLLKSKDEDNPILGEKIKNLTEFSSNNGAIYKYDFLEKLNNYLNPRIDIVLNKIKVQDKNLKINEAYYFKKDKIAGTLNQEEVILTSLFKNDNNIFLDFDIDDKYYILKIDESKTRIKTKDGIDIDLEIIANLDSVHTDYDLKKSYTIAKLNKHASSSLKKKYKDLFDKLIENKSDILMINDYIYRTEYAQKYNFFKDKININVDVTISKKGLMQNTIGGYNNEKKQ